MLLGTCVQERWNRTFGAFLQTLDAEYNYLFHSSMTEWGWMFHVRQETRQISKFEDYSCESVKHLSNIQFEERNKPVFLYSNFLNSRGFQNEVETVQKSAVEK